MTEVGAWMLLSQPHTDLTKIRLSYRCSAIKQIFVTESSLGQLHPTSRSISFNCTSTAKILASNFSVNQIMERKKCQEVHIPLNLFGLPANLAFSSPARISAFACYLWLPAFLQTELCWFPISSLASVKGISSFTGWAMSELYEVSILLILALDVPLSPWCRQQHLSHEGSCSSRPQRPHTAHERGLSLSYPLYK